MNIYLIGHTYQYAVEQSLLTLFPGQKPVYPSAPEPGESITVKQTRGRRWTTMTTTLRFTAGTYRGSARIENSRLTQEPFVTDRLLQRLVRQSFYKAALKSGIPAPEWGALTGVRPTKLMTRLMERGLTDAQAKREFRREFGVSPARAELCVDTAHDSMTAAASLTDKSVCLYVGIPFCPTRCAYCSFVSQAVAKSMKLIDPFFDALLQEVEATAKQVRALGLQPVSLYMGGGTPTTLSAPQLDALFSKLEAEFDMSKLRENTVEAGRPDTITKEKLEVLKAHGVTRVSVNPQTMEDSVLDAIGRKHTARDILDALSLVRETGGMAVNMDLIAGLPTDTPDGFRRTLDTVLSLSPENVTVHTLSLKKGATLKDEGGDVPGAQDVAQMLDYAFPRLRAAGYRPYYLYRQKNMAGGFENTGWTRPGAENLYNICIMEELCSILAMGAGGSTKLIAPTGKIQRIFAPKYPNEYIANIQKTCSDKERIEAFYGISSQ